MRASVDGPKAQSRAVAEASESVQRPSLDERAAHDTAKRKGSSPPRADFDALSTRPLPPPGAETVDGTLLLGAPPASTFRAVAIGSAARHAGGIGTDESADAEPEPTERQHAENVARFIHHRATAPPKRRRLTHSTDGSTEPAAAAATTDSLARIGTLEQNVQQLLARTRDLEIQLQAYKMAQPVVLVGESEGGRWCAPECLLAPRDGYRRAVPFDYSVMTWFTRHGGTAHLRLPCLRVCASARVCVCTYAHAGVRVWFYARVCTRSRRRTSRT